MTNLLTQDALAFDIPAPPKPEPGVRNWVQNVKWESQHGDQWCWAACVVMIFRALKKSHFPDGREVTQCRVYARAKCQDPEWFCIKAQVKLSGECRTLDCATAAARRTEGVVSETLTRLLPPDAPLASSEPGIDKMSDADIREMIDSGWPVAVLTIPKGSTRRHYVLIIGYDTEAGRYDVWDPDPDPKRGGVLPISRGRWSKIGTWEGAVALRPRPGQ